MADRSETRGMVRLLFESAGLEVSNQDLDIVSALHHSFAGQRSRLAGAARPDIEPMIVPAFDRIPSELETADDRVS
ncbi:hypothetical protein BH23CHL2_BH23CHL2_28470 [soil metagenome]